MTLTEEITQRLQILAPTKLTLTDDSALHAGHSGNTGGCHFRLNITSSHFYQKSHIMRHRAVYDLLSDLIPTKIHALSILATTPDELES